LNSIANVFLWALLIGADARANAAGRDSLEYHPPLFEGRLLAGFNFSQLDGDTYAGYHKVGINAGGMVYVHLLPILGIGGGRGTHLYP